MSQRPGPADDGTGLAHRTIGVGIIWVGLFVLVAKAAGAAKEMAVAAQFGVGPVVDAYALIQSIALWPVAVAVSVLTAVLVPLETRLAVKAPSALFGLRRELFGAALCLAAVITLVLGLVLPLCLGTLGLKDEALSAGRALLWPLVLSSSFAMVAALFSTWILAQGAHANSLLDATPSLVLLLALVAWAGPGVEVLAWGSTAGTLIHAGLAFLIAYRVAGPLGGPTFGFRSQGWPELRSALGLTVIGQVLLSSTAIVEQVIAAHLSVGAVSTLSYANRLLFLVLGVGALAVNRATLPVFSRMAAASDDRGRAVAVTWAWRMFWTGCVAMLVTALVARPAVELLFERGRFTAADTAAVSEALRAASIQLPPYLAGLVWTSYVAATSRFRLLFIAAVVAFAVRLAMAWFAGLWAGVPGLAAAPAAAYGVTLMLFAHLTKRGRP